MNYNDMVEEFQCPGCVKGSNTNCGYYLFSDSTGKCLNHILGTQKGLGHKIALGLPKGFNNPGFNNLDSEEPKMRDTIDIRFWLKDDAPEWNHLNVPVWALEKDGFLFVRTYSPRIDKSWIDIVANGNFDMVPNAINVSNFIDDID